MLLLETERYIVETTLALTSIPTDAPTITLLECLPELKKSIDNGTAVYSMRKGRVQIRIKQYEERLYDENDVNSGTALALLIQYVDSDASDPSFGKMDTGEIRVVEKEDNEGLSVTAHLVIELKSINEAMPAVHNAVLEDVNGINKTNISSALTKILHDCTDFEFMNEETRKLNKCRPRVKLDINAGHKLKELLDKGFVAGFKAVKYKTDVVLDDEGDLELKEECIILKSKHKRGEAALDMIKRAAKFAKNQEYSRLMVRYQDDNKKQSTLNVSTREEDFTNGLFGKSEKVILGETIQQCEKKIHEELASKMVSCLIKMSEG
ncbi:hypothetical protein [Aliivibrio fischeri]|uniref:hypothetical protein n=1 Tax=Aliivibrio fischeri TaxID=668 RepID=UPI00080D9AC2|nr:hypothetical protein [Aliivibrio fischeri]OCH04990.1 hypothetical protein A6E10_11675 [Aliivibrio fischeri]